MKFDSIVDEDFKKRKCIFENTVVQKQEYSYICVYIYIYIYIYIYYIYIYINKYS